MALQARIRRQLQEAKPPTAEELEARSIATLNKKIEEWKAKGWGFPAHLLQHFIDKKRPAPYQPTSEDIAEVKKESDDLIRAVLSEVVWRDPRIKSCNSFVFDLGKKDVRWVASGAVGVIDESRSNEKYPYLDTNDFMFYAYGGARLYLKGTVKNI